MNGALRLLIKVFVRRYYLLNTGFFLVIFLLMFGVIDPGASLRLHLDLMILMGLKPKVLAGAIALLGLYFIKCLRFALRQSGLPENAMLYELQGLPRSRLRSYLALSFAGMYAPALAYCTCVLIVSIAHRCWGVIVVSIISQAGLLLLAVRVLENSLRHRMRTSRSSGLIRRMDKLRPEYLRFGQYFAAHLLAQRKVMLLLLKAGSLLLLQLMVYINRDEPERLGTFYLLLFLIVAHGMLPWRLRDFSEDLPWLRNLPIPILRRFAAFAGTYALLFLPELLFLLLHVRAAMSFGDMLSFYALSTAMLCAMHAMLYFRGMNMDRYVLVLMMIYPLSIIALAIVTPWAMAGFWMACAMTIFRLRYRRFEREEQLG